MRKKIVCLSIVAGIIGLAGSANAAYFSSASGAALTVGTAGTDPAVVSFQPSPGVSMGVFSTASAYAINGLNAVVSAGNRNEYLIVNTAAGYYQLQTDTLSVLGDETPDISTYTYQGGS